MKLVDEKLGVFVTPSEVAAVAARKASMADVEMTDEDNRKVEAMRLHMQSE